MGENKNLNPEIEIEEELTEEKLNEQRIIRREKLKALQELPDIMQPIADKAENADSA